MKIINFTLLLSINTFMLTSSLPSFGQLIKPENLEYQGAFRLPDTSLFEYGWYWGGSALTYYPKGDSAGLADGYPGSLLGVGHDWNMYISEINIPVPIISESKNLDELNPAHTLQKFQNVRNNLFQDSKGNPLFYEMIRVGLEYLPSPSEDDKGKLHLVWGQHLQEDEKNPSHMMCGLNLSDPQSQGGWFFSIYSNYVSNDYIFGIPEAATAQIGSRMRLACGRFRDGLWSGRGPALFAYDPFPENLAEGDTIKNVTPLMLYGIQQKGNQHIITADTMTVNNFKEADEWVGGAWITCGTSSAVIFVGTKGVGKCWYGLPDGTLWEEPYPQDPQGQRGWWCEKFKAQILFFDPGELIQVAREIRPSWYPQPYDSLNIDSYLFSIDSLQQLSRVSSVGYDRKRNHLFIMERRADNDKPLVHIWKITEHTKVKSSENHSTDFLGVQNFPNPFNTQTFIRFKLNKPSRVKIKIYNLKGREIKTRIDSYYQRGNHLIRLDGTQLSSGIYFYSIYTEDFIATKKMIILK